MFWWSPTPVAAEDDQRRGEGLDESIESLFRPSLPRKGSLVMMESFKLVHLVATAAGAILLNSPAYAADASGLFAVRGLGANTCQEYLNRKATDENSRLYASWLMGYMTARNRVEEKRFDVLPYPDGQVFLEAVQAVCRDQTTVTIEQAASSVISALAPIHQVNVSPITVVENKNRSLQIRQSALAALQSKLIEDGLYSGPVNGEWSEAMVTAVTEFQLSSKIVASGLPDLATLIHALVLDRPHRANP